MVRHLEKRIQQVELDAQEKVSWICSLYLLHWHVYFRPCLRCFVLFCFRFRFNYLGIDNKILDAKFFVRSYNLQHVFFVFLFDSLTSENNCTRTGHEWRTQWRRGWGGGCEHVKLVSSPLYKVWLPKWRVSVMEKQNSFFSFYSTVVQIASAAWRENKRSYAGFSSRGK